MTSVEKDESKPPASVRTPGRTWTEFPSDIDPAGAGTVAVDAPEAVEISTPRETELFGHLSPEENAVRRLHAQELEPEEDAVLIRFPEGEQVREPVTVRTAAEAGFFPHHVVVVVEEGASGRVTEINTGAGEMDASVIEVDVREAGSLQYQKLNDLETRAGYADAHAAVAERGAIEWMVVSTGTDIYRSDVGTELQGRDSRLDYRLGFLTSGEQHMDHTAHVIHAADRTSCDMESRGVAMDASRAVYKGVQEVEEGAEGTESFQNEKTVVLGDDAEADTTPQLRIDNSDVEATHAATTGHVDRGDLYYMMSRGLREERAKQEIISGMFDDLLETEQAILQRKIRAEMG